MARPMPRRYGHDHVAAADCNRRAMDRLRKRYGIAKPSLWSRIVAWLNTEVSL